MLDLLCGPAARGCDGVVGPGARIAHLGQSAAPNATIASGLVRGKQLAILGYSNFAVPLDVLAQGYADVVGHAVAGPASASTPRPCRSIASGRRGRGRRSGRDVKLVLVP